MNLKRQKHSAGNRLIVKSHPNVFRFFRLFEIPLGFGNIFVFLLQIWENNNFEILMIFWLLKENA